ncbi:hypothetical protein ACWGH2_25440 [Streptomyces sp. NPDC054871]
MGRGNSQRGPAPGWTAKAAADEVTSAILADPKIARAAADALARAKA